MANQSNIMLLLAVIFFLATTSAVVAQDLDLGVGLNISGIVEATVQGRLVCTATGNPAPGVNISGIAGVNVTLTADINGRTTLAQAVTDPQGFYEMVAVNVSTAIDVILNGTVNIRLPIASCAALPTTGSLEARLIPLGIVDSVLAFATGFLALVV